MASFLPYFSKVVTRVLLASLFFSSSIAFHLPHNEKANLRSALRAEPIKVAILGSTGSVGTQTLDIIRSINKISKEPKFKVVALTANKNSTELARQAEEFKPNSVNINFNAEELRYNIRPSVNITSGVEGLMQLCNSVDYDIVVMGISGCAGIEPTVAAAKRGKKLALANKESIVSAGNLLRKVIERSRCEIIPIDSEHNALYQCLMTSARDYVNNGMHRTEGTLCSISPSVRNSIKSLILTGSGGPFRDTPLSMMKSLRVKDALKHPVWDMGAKITIDSSTMMNKGLEVIEAHHLFGIPYDQIKVLIHKECIVHSLVEFVDKSIIAQLYIPDMKLPIAYALNWPDRTENSLPRLDLANNSLTFAEPDLEKFPCLRLAFEVGKIGGLYPTVLNAANEQANEILRNDSIAYAELYDYVRSAVEAFSPPMKDRDDMEGIMEAHKWGKQYVINKFKSNA